jgi:hypothetical protein
MFFKQEIFGPQVAFQPLLWNESLTYCRYITSFHNTFQHRKVKNMSILIALDPHQIPNVRIRIPSLVRISIPPKRSGSDRIYIRIRNTAVKYFSLQICLECFLFFLLRKSTRNLSRLHLRRRKQTEGEGHLSSIFRHFAFLGSLVNDDNFSREVSQP